MKTVIQTDKYQALSWLCDVLEDLRDLPKADDSIHEVCRRMNSEFAELFPSNIFVRCFCAGQIPEVRTVTAVMERFIEIAYKVRHCKNKKLPIGQVSH